MKSILPMDQISLTCNCNFHIKCLYQHFQTILKNDLLKIASSLDIYCPNFRNQFCEDKVSKRIISQKQLDDLAIKYLGKDNYMKIVKKIEEKKEKEYILSCCGIIDNVDELKRDIQK